jgi:hypothetical protein
MGSLLSFPVGLFHPYNMPVVPGALRYTDNTSTETLRNTAALPASYFGCVLTSGAQAQPGALFSGAQTQSGAFFSGVQAQSGAFFLGAQAQPGALFSGAQAQSGAFLLGAQAQSLSDADRPITDSNPIIRASTAFRFSILTLLT